MRNSHGKSPPPLPHTRLPAGLQSASSRRRASVSWEQSRSGRPFRRYSSPWPRCTYRAFLHARRLRFSKQPTGALDTSSTPDRLAAAPLDNWCNRHLDTPYRYLVIDAQQRKNPARRSGAKCHSDGGHRHQWRWPARRSGREHRLQRSGGPLVRVSGQPPGSRPRRRSFQRLRRSPGCLTAMLKLRFSRYSGGAAKHFKMLDRGAKKPNREGGEVPSAVQFWPNVLLDPES